MGQNGGLRVKQMSELGSIDMLDIHNTPLLFSTLIFSVH